MGRSLRGWCRLNRTTGCWWWFRESATLLRREAFHADEWLEVFCGNLLVKASYSLNVEAHRVLFLGHFECAISGPHWTRNSSTYVERLLCLTLRGSVRARTRRMDALPPGASLPLRGSVTGACFRLEDWVCFDPFFRLFLKCRAIRVPSLVVGWVGVGRTFRRASSIVVAGTPC